MKEETGKETRETKEKSEKEKTREETEKKKEKKEVKEEKKIEKEERKVESEEITQAPSKIEHTERDIAPILKKDIKGERLEEFLAETPIEKKKEEKKYEIKPDYNPGFEDTEEKKYIKEGGERNERRWEEVTQPRVEKSTDLFPRRERPVHMQRMETKVKVREMEKPQEFVKYEQRKEMGREPFEESLDWHKKERKIKKYEK